MEHFTHVRGALVRDSRTGRAGWVVEPGGPILLRGLDGESTWHAERPDVHPLTPDEALSDRVDVLNRLIAAHWNALGRD